MTYLVQRPEGEILGMGGPWIGQVYRDGQPLPGDYLMQKEAVDPSKQYIALVGTNQPRAKARSEVVFWITIVSLTDGLLYRSRATWPALYVEEITASQIGFYPMFYAGQPAQKQYLPFELTKLFEPLI